MRVYPLRDSIRKRNLEEAGMTGKPRKGGISFFPCEVTQNVITVTMLPPLRWHALWQLTSVIPQAVSSPA
jgi:hypothetical protein